jgi:replicative DNA helicase
MNQRDASHDAEQAVLAALLADSDALGEIADLLRPELFSVSAHAEVAREILALASEKLPADPVLVSQRLAARKAVVPGELPLSLMRAIGTAGNLRHYAEVLDGLWAKREARKVMAEALRSDVDLPAEEFVGSVAQKLSAIETRRGRGAQSLARLMFERLDRREEIQKNPDVLTATTWRTGYGALDALVGGFRAGHLFTIAARPGVGKSAFVTSVTDYVAGKGAPVGIIQLEDYADAVADRALMRTARIPSTLMRDGARWSADMWQKAQFAVNMYANLPVYVDDTHGRTIHDIVGAMRRMHREFGIRVFVLDNLAEVVVDRAERGEERLDRALGRMAKQYRDAAAALGAAPVLVVHLNRDVEKRGDGRPRMSDLKNSGEIEDASHVVAMLSRPPESDVLTVDVVKNRNGPPGLVSLRFDRDTMSVRDEREAA